jgi:hypothetical protein
MGHFIQDDPRGEYWLYSEGGLEVSIGRGGIGQVCHFNTSDIHVRSGGPLSSGKVAAILAELMLEFGSDRGGYDRLTLHLDGKYDLSAENLTAIDQALSQAGFRLRDAFDNKELRWVKPA